MHDPIELPIQSLLLLVDLLQSLINVHMNPHTQLESYIFLLLPHSSSSLSLRKPSMANSQLLTVFPQIKLYLHLRASPNSTPPSNIDVVAAFLEFAGDAQIELVDPAMQATPGQTEDTPSSTLLPWCSRAPSLSTTTPPVAAIAVDPPRLHAPPAVNTGRILTGLTLPETRRHLLSPTAVAFADAVAGAACTRRPDSKRVETPRKPDSPEFWRTVDQVNSGR